MNYCHSDDPGDEAPVAPELPCYFDEQGRPVGVVDPVFEGEPDTTDSAGSVELEPFLACLMTAATSVGTVGERVACLAYLLNVQQVRSLRDLARLLGVSHVTAQKRVNRFRAEIAKEMRLFVRKSLHAGVLVGRSNI